MSTAQSPDETAGSAPVKAKSAIGAWLDKVFTKVPQIPLEPDTEKTKMHAIKRLVALKDAHGGSGTAILENMGRSGARIVLVAADGTYGDATVPNMEIAAAVAEAACLTVGTWDRETSGLIAPTSKDRQRMAGTGR